MNTRAVVAILPAVSSVVAAADDRETYNRRAADNDMMLFRQLDLDKGAAGWRTTGPEATSISGRVSATSTSIAMAS